jgi:hypothetical protein
MVVIWLVMVLATIALIVISENMARERGRSATAWGSLAAFTGPLPLAPLALYLPGNRKRTSS